MGSTRIRRSLSSPELDRKAFRVAEENYLDRLQANLNATAGIFNPSDNRTYDASPRNRVTKRIDDRSTEVKALIKKYVERDLQKTLDEMPKNDILLVEVTHKELLSAKAVKVAVAGASFSPSEDLVRTGKSSRRAGPAELNRFKDLVVTQPSVFYFLGAFSPSGWDDGCRHVLVGGNYLVALMDLYEGAWRTFFAPDARWRSGARVFDLTSDDEKIEAIRAFVLRHTAELLMDELTEDFIFDELGYSIPIIREAFEEMSAEDKFVRFDTGTRPYRLVRNYG